MGIGITHVNFEGDMDVLKPLLEVVPMEEVAAINANARAASALHESDDSAAGAGAGDDDNDNTLPEPASGGASSFSVATHEVTEHNLIEALGGCRCWRR